MLCNELQRVALEEKMLAKGLQQTARLEQARSCSSLASSSMLMSILGRFHNPSLIYCSGFRSFAILKDPTHVGTHVGRLPARKDNLIEVKIKVKTTCGPFLCLCHDLFLYLGPCPPVLFHPDPAALARGRSLEEHRSFASLHLQPGKL